MRPNLSLAVLLACQLVACAKQRGTPDHEPTLKSLQSRPLIVLAEKGHKADEAQAIAAYRNFLDLAPAAPQRAEALRRIGDLEMARADTLSELPQATDGPDYRAAIERYQEFLKLYPEDKSNDRVLYQLARAQEQGGRLESALATLDILVQRYPATTYREEAQFRRGELLFAARNYVSAQAAYATVLQGGASGRYYDRALYMQGWTQFKQGKLEEALQSFFSVLDLKLAGHANTGDLASLQGMSRGDRELAEDTFRVTSLSLANLQGADSIAAYTSTPARQNYEFRVYEQLGELYLKQERIKDSADTFALFARRRPLDANAPLLQARVIDIYARNGFATLALEAKKEYVARYGRSSEFRQANPTGWELAQPLVKLHIAELARHYHAAAQKSKTAQDYEEAIGWYRETLAAFPKDPDAPESNFLLAELLFETRRFGQAQAEYDRTAYAYPLHARSSDAAYAALLSVAHLLKETSPEAAPELQRTSITSALKFANTFAADSRAPAVLSDAAEKLFALKDSVQATAVAQQILDLQPQAPAAQRRIAWTVLAYTRFDQGEFAPSERAFAEVLQLTPDNAPTRAALLERQAASVYKQGEAARATGQMAEAVTQFQRVALVAPQSPIRANAQFDAATALMALKNWSAAIAALQDFRQRYLQHPLQGDIGPKLVAVYLETEQWGPAALELERISTSHKDPKVAADALWQAAGLHQKAGARALAVKAYERYLIRPAMGLEAWMEARYQLAQLAEQDGNRARELTLMKELLQADQTAGSARSARSRYLGATAALALAEPVANAYRNVQLTEPLQRQLKLKKGRMEEALKAYALASEYGVADVTTAATYRIALVYRDFGKALMASERPKRLSKVEREQYDVLLEEQAFPFEEKAAAFHEINTQRTTAGIYDEWVKRSFEALRELRPVRYGKTERIEMSLDAQARGKPPGAIAELVRAAPEGTARAPLLNLLGVKHRESGAFDKARTAYEQALALDPLYANALRNLGILQDLYLNSSTQAQTLFGRYLALVPGDAVVAKWVAELKNRKPQNAALAAKENP